MTTSSTEQLAALSGVAANLDCNDVEYRLFGGWAVDFYAGTITRTHDDIDLAVWMHDVPKIDELLTRDGWRHAPYEDEDGGTGYERDGVRLELTFLVETDRAVCIPLRHGPTPWDGITQPGEVRELHGVRAHLIALDALRRGKSSPRDDAEDAVKDRADFERLRTLA